MQQQDEIRGGRRDRDDGWLGPALKSCEHRSRRRRSVRCPRIWRAIQKKFLDTVFGALAGNGSGAAGASCASQRCTAASCTWWRAIAPTVRSSFHQVHAGVSHGTSRSASSSSRVDTRNHASSSRRPRTDRSAPPGTRDRARRRAPSWPRTAGPDRGAESTRSATNRGANSTRAASDAGEIVRGRRRTFRFDEAQDVAAFEGHEIGPLRGRGSRNIGTIRQSTTSGCARAVSSSAQGSSIASTARPAPTNTLNQPVSMRPRVTDREGTVAAPQLLRRRAERPGLGQRALDEVVADGERLTLTRVVDDPPPHPRAHHWMQYRELHENSPGLSTRASLAQRRLRIGDIHQAHEPGDEIEESRRRTAGSPRRRGRSGSHDGTPRPPRR